MVVQLVEGVEQAATYANVRELELVAALEDLDWADLAKFGNKRNGDLEMKQEHSLVYDQ